MNQSVNQRIKVKLPAQTTTIKSKATPAKMRRDFIFHFHGTNEKPYRNAATIAFVLNLVSRIYKSGFNTWHAPMLNFVGISKN